jgi:hypothetical protein
MVFQIAPEERHVNRKIQIAIMNPRGVTCFNVRIDWLAKCENEFGIIVENQVGQRLMKNKISD